MAKKRYSGPYVSRGGEKLRGALEDFAYDPRGKRVLDVGASTGGFTDCLLQAGARSVVALDVAYGQFAWSLRQDDRVQVLERTNFRSADLQSLPQLSNPEFAAPYDLVVADLSFISLLKLLDQFKQVLSDDGELILLLKPQFEALKEEVPKGGVIADPGMHVEILERVNRGFSNAGLSVSDWTYSPLKGPRGNIEFWIRAQRSIEEKNDSRLSESVYNCATIEKVVKAAHLEFNS
jgi:23S rRNA (cytidine1920-2'-O)/16S rRNA (cytidine1409-2'-O)-methyltransferase